MIAVLLGMCLHSKKEEEKWWPKKKSFFRNFAQHFCSCLLLSFACLSRCPPTLLHPALCPGNLTLYDCLNEFSAVWLLEEATAPFLLWGLRKALEEDQEVEEEWRWAIYFSNFFPADTAKVGYNSSPEASPLSVRQELVKTGIGQGRSGKGLILQMEY